LKPILRQGLRWLCIAYILVLWLGVLPIRLWPFEGWGLAGRLRGTARQALAALTLTPGDVIFTGSAGEWKIAANCLRVVGETQAGGQRLLYQSECPNRKGFRLRNPPFDQVLQEMTRVPFDLPLRADSPAARRLREIAAYYCHSPLEAHPPLRSVSLRQVVLVQSAWSGRRMRDAALLCESGCQPGVDARPVCERRGRPEPLDAGA